MSFPFHFIARGAYILYPFGKHKSEARSQNASLKKFMCAVNCNTNLKPFRKRAKDNSINQPINWHSPLFDHNGIRYKQKRRSMSDVFYLDFS
ncbi:hypothetical protein A6E00_19715 [Vibrio diabolicus]|nr:hypothetical protein AL537_23775 [Vibrio diabolicus]OCH70416.1 hypothetical protein A6E00_19715 [Vibrio diabolicus]OKQ17780.1 hypothetical protein H058_16245 [Vibrio antiquarius]